MKSEQLSSERALKKEIQALFREALGQGIFPGAAVGICLGLAEERRKHTFFFGNRALIPKPLPLRQKTFFDLASLTKPLATTLAVLALIKEGKIRIEQKLSSIFPDIPEDKKDITIEQILAHRAGFPAYRKYFKKTGDLPLQERKKRIKQSIFRERLQEKPGTVEIYSDLGFILLGFIIEQLSGEELDHLFRERIAAPIGLERQIFFRRRSGEKERNSRRFAATEQCHWRNRMIIGEVQDENTSVLEGVSGQAGLFGNIEGVLAMTAALLDQWKGRGVHRAFRNEDLQIFLERRQGKEQGRVLGFDTPEQEGSSAGRYLSKKSVGHLGFTGTSFWIDPERDLVVVLLTNRIHPSRKNDKIKAFRPFFHDRVVELLGLV